MARADVESRRDVIDGRDLFIVALQDLECSSHKHRSRSGEVFAIRLAAKASPKAGLFGIVGRREERHVLSLRTPRRTRRPAESTGRLDAEVKHAVELRVRRLDRPQPPI